MSHFVEKDTPYSVNYPKETDSQVAGEEDDNEATQFKPQTSETANEKPENAPENETQE